MRRWVHARQDDEDLSFFFEIDHDGYFRRVVMLEGPERLAVIACSLDEVEAAFRNDTINEYGETYGVPLSWSAASPDWDYTDPEPLSETEFEEAWADARQARATGSRRDLD
ncbi:hypothetical protein [Actinocorallia herbida]|nr:hypothetical protein [Actinocorallia herbida]